MIMTLHMTNYNNNPNLRKKEKILGNMPQIQDIIRIEMNKMKILIPNFHRFRPPFFLQVSKF